MTALAALLALALAAGPTDAPRRTGVDPSNAARARAGLLPRKAARTRTEVVRGGRRIVTVRAPSPTYLPEPAPLAEDGPVVEDDAGEEALARSEAEPAPRLVAARGTVETVRLADAGPAEAVAAIEPIAAAVVAPPEELGALRAAAAGVSTEVTLRLRYDP